MFHVSEKGVLTSNSKDLKPNCDFKLKVHDFIIYLFIYLFILLVWNYLQAIKTNESIILLNSIIKTNIFHHLIFYIV